jgi:NAD(P)H dehydrogenase (quinone)
MNFNNMNPTILIAGATGATGRVATKILLEKGLSVRAFVHNEDERSQKLQALGADIAVGDLLDFQSVQKAFKGIKRAYFVYPIRPGIVQATVHFAEAAREAGVEIIVNLSQSTARKEAESISAQQHWLAEQVLNWSGVPVTHLHPTAFNEWLLYMRKQIANGVYAVPFSPSGRFAPIAAEDQGGVIAGILADPEPHKGKTYPLRGPVELTPSEIAKIVSDTLGKEVRYEHITGAQWVLNLYGQDIPFLSQHIAGIVPDHAEGIMSGTSNIVKEITGHEPMSVAEFVEKNRAAFEL